MKWKTVSACFLMDTFKAFKKIDGDNILDPALMRTVVVSAEEKRVAQGCGMGQLRKCVVMEWRPDQRRAWKGPYRLFKLRRTC